jgi:hypothetical protein
MYNGRRRTENDMTWRDEKYIIIIVIIIIII